MNGETLSAWNKQFSDGSVNLEDGIEEHVCALLAVFNGRMLQLAVAVTAVRRDKDHRRGHNIRSELRIVTGAGVHAHGGIAQFPGALLDEVHIGLMEGDRRAAPCLLVGEGALFDLGRDLPDDIDALLHDGGILMARVQREPDEIGNDRMDIGMAGDLLFLSAIRQNGYLMMPGVLPPTPSSSRRMRPLPYASTNA